MSPNLPALTPSTTQGWFAELLKEISYAVVGQTVVVEQLLLPLLCREHAMVEAPAGAAKSLAIEGLGRCFGLDFRRLRCSGDVVLSDLIDSGPWRGIWSASLLLVENMDRLTPKLQHLLQAAMSERAVPGPDRLPVPDPFVVYATRYRADETAEADAVELDDQSNDRFMFKVNVPYPTYRDEYLMAAMKSGEVDTGREAKQLFSRAQLDSWRSLVNSVEAAPSVVHYAVRLARATRVHEGENPDFIYEWVQRGAGPRAAHFLVLAAKARATLYGRSAALHEDVRHLALPVLRHRLVTNRNARTNGIDADRVIQRLLNEVPPRVVGDDQIPAAGTALTFHDWIPADDFPAS